MEAFTSCLPETEIKTEMIEVTIEVDQKEEPPKNESEERLIEVKIEYDSELGIKEHSDSPEIKFCNTQDYLDIGDTVISEPSGAPASISTDNKCGTARRNKKPREKLHTTEKLYKCEVCDYRCKVSSSLKRHTRTHTGEKPFKCNACDYRFTQDSTLKQHLRIHTGEKPYKCEACNYRCSVSSSLKKHVRIHTGEKPYKCETCDYRCTANSKLREHMRTHTRKKLFKCEVCNYRCTVSGSLKKHMRAHGEMDVTLVRRRIPIDTLRVPPGHWEYSTFFSRAPEK